MKPISNIVILDLQENIYTQVPQTHYMSADEAGWHVVGFLDILYSYVLYRIDYIVCGFHLWYNI